MDVFVGRICFWVSFRKRWRRKWEREENVLLMLRGSSCRSWYAEPWSLSFRIGLIPSSSASLFNYLKSKTARECVKTQYVSQPPSPLTSCKTSLVCSPASGWLPPWVPFFLDTLCRRGFGQEFEIPASAVSLLSPALHWQMLLIFFF